MSERTRLEEIRKRDAVLHPSWFTVDDTDDCVLRVDQTLAARAIKDRRWLLELVDDLRARDAHQQGILASCRDVLDYEGPDDALPEVVGLLPVAIRERYALYELVRDVARSGVELDDARLGYVTVQIDRETWEQCRAVLARKGD